MKIYNTIINKKIILLLFLLGMARFAYADWPNDSYGIAILGTLFTVVMLLYSIVYIFICGIKTKITVYHVISLFIYVIYWQFMSSIWFRNGAFQELLTSSFGLAHVIYIIIIVGSIYNIYFMYKLLFSKI